MALFVDPTQAPYNADPTGTVDACAALNAAATECRATGAELWLKGHFLLGTLSARAPVSGSASGTITYLVDFSGVHVRGVGSGAWLQAANGLAFPPATFDPATGRCTMAPCAVYAAAAVVDYDCSLSGRIDISGNMPSAFSSDKPLRRPDQGWGLFVQGGCKITGVHASSFDMAYVVDSSIGGHTLHERVKGDGSWYGLSWVSMVPDTPRASGGNDIFWGNCDFSGNIFASIGFRGDFQPIGIQVRDSHLGFAPYGIYQEARIGNAPDDTRFLSGCFFDATQFESVGNGAIYTERWSANDGLSGTVNGLDIRRSALIWGGPQYWYPGQEREYSIKVAGIFGRASLESLAEFTWACSPQGGSQTFYLGALDGRFDYQESLGVYFPPPIPVVTRGAEGYRYRY